MLDDQQGDGTCVRGQQTALNNVILLQTVQWGSSQVQGKQSSEAAVRCKANSPVKQ